ncbi:unnamed protein product [Pararhodospirillum photometricum DSM 122]|uniref:Uncharacterized protein n=1 Tax=Pararhodospirillum photometricum DSM 122 TaxID=1150469 RepID=H6SM48_PARPM|nr:unnamed protein product [Pararhodospirillum photometricum DSM 122]
MIELAETAMFVGASLTGVTLTVTVREVLEADPSLLTTVRLRAVVVGASLVLL